MNAGLEFRDLVSGYGDTVVVRDVSGTVATGKVLGILGRNGVGKTTLVRALMGLLPLQGGEMRWKGQDLSKVPTHMRVSQGIAYAPQENVVFGDLSVEENLWLHLGRPDPGRYTELLQQFPRISERRMQLAGSLSGGERKLLSFVRTLGLRTDLSILDEPTEGVQPENIDRMAASVLRRTAQGASFVIVEQNLSFLEAIADDVLVLDHGNCVLQGNFRALGRQRLEEHLLV